MKKIFFLLFMTAACTFHYVNGQRTQVTTGTANADEKWAIVEDPAINAFVAIGNTTPPGGISSVWVSSYDAAGTVLTSAIASNGRRMIARDISLAPPEPLTGRTSYYITGWTETATASGPLNQAFAARILLNGSFVWYNETPTLGIGSQEGVAIVTEPASSDAIVLGNAMMPTGSKIVLTRFDVGGGVWWSNLYDAPDDWIGREIAFGAPTICSAGSSLPGEFIITGETNTGGIGSQTFAALYNGMGTECWRNLYPVGTAYPSTGDAGYDVVWDPAINVYVIVGVAEAGLRQSANSTPYILSVFPNGTLAGATVYTTLARRGMGLYPRTVSLGQGPGEIVFSGPDYGSTPTKTLFGKLATALVPPPGFFANYNGYATANFVPQPFILNDAPPEDILFTSLGRTQSYLISTNAMPTGRFGAGDGHLIRTDLAGATPDSCNADSIRDTTVRVGKTNPVAHVMVPLSPWLTAGTTYVDYPVMQFYCKDTCFAKASFTTAPPVGTNVNFSSTSTGSGSIVKYEWDFGDLSPIITTPLPNISHTYPATGGPFTACLTIYIVNASGDTCKDKVCKTISFCDVKASFTTAISCKTVTLTSTSTGTGPLTYEWYFDGSTTPGATGASVLHTFATCGPHTVRLITRSSPTCADTVTTTVDIPCCTTAADFCLTADGLSVTFTNTSVPVTPGTTTYTVTLDGLPVTWASGTARTLTAGKHTVCVKATRVYCGETCCATVCKTIWVSPPCAALTADFWFNVRGSDVIFTNRSTTTVIAGTTLSYFWEFGNGSTSNLAAPGTIPYAAPGTYTACVTVTRISGKDTCRKKACKTIVIDPPCPVQAKYKATYCTKTPLKVDFTNQSTGAVRYEWNFGDGPFISRATDTSYTFPRKDSFIVCLKAIVSDNCWSMACYKLYVSDTTRDTSCTTWPPSPFKTVGGVVAEEVKVLETITTNSTGVKDGLTLYPNPAFDKLRVAFESAGKTGGTVTVSNSAGQAVYQTNLQFVKGKNMFDIPVQSYPSGIYYINVSAGDARYKSHFVVGNR